MHSLERIYIKFKSHLQLAINCQYSYISIIIKHFFYNCYNNFKKIKQYI
jgi:hypothetical protein